MTAPAEADRQETSVHWRPATRILAAASAGVRLTTPVLAQADLSSLARNAAANELGIPEYCHASDDIDDNRTAARRTAIARLPASTGPADAAETLGRQGTLPGASGTNIPPSHMAARGSVSENDLSTRMAGSVKQASSKNPAMSMATMAGGMPVTPNRMPALPH